MIMLARCTSTAHGGHSTQTPTKHEHGSGHVAEAHGHHHEPFDVPDYRVFHADGVPQLEELRSKLAAEGLRDYWIRYSTHAFCTVNAILSPFTVQYSASDNVSHSLIQLNLLVSDCSCAATSRGSIRCRRWTRQWSASSTRSGGTAGRARSSSSGSPSCSMRCSAGTTRRRPPTRGSPSCSLMEGTTRNTLPNTAQTARTRTNSLTPRYGLYAIVC